MWKCAKICSHTIACAYQDNCLRDFLSKITETPNFYALSKCGTPCSAGKKPINVRHAQSLQQKHCQVCKRKYSHVLPILVLQLLTSCSFSTLQFFIGTQFCINVSLVLCSLVVLKLQVNLPLKLLSQFQHCWRMYSNVQYLSHRELRGQCMYLLQSYHRRNLQWCLHQLCIVLLLHPVCKQLVLHLLKQ